MAEENGLDDHSCYRMNLRQVYGTALYSEQREHLKCKYDVSARIRNIGPDGHKEYRSYGDSDNLLECAREALDLININRMMAKNGNFPPADYDDATTEEADVIPRPRKRAKVSTTTSDDLKEALDTIKMVSEKVDVLGVQVCNLWKYVSAIHKAFGEPEV